jgi:hypothetical protein
MFIQEFHGKVRDPALWKRQLEMWNDELRPGAKGFLGSTSGLTPDGEMVSVVRFESEAAARASSERPEQKAWYEATKQAFDGEITFHDCSDVDLYKDGGSDAAGFVQVMEGHAKDPARMREMEQAFDAEMSRVRPDILGSITGWEPDGSFVTIAYFTSESEARKNETKMADDPRFAELMQQMEPDSMTFYDLKEPVFA